MSTLRSRLLKQCCFLIMLKVGYMVVYSDSDVLLCMSVLCSAWFILMDSLLYITESPKIQHKGEN